MMTCTVHEAPDPSADRLERAERLEMVKDGFSWSALLLGPVWLLWHRLWLAFLGWAVLVAGLALLAKGLRLDPGALGWVVFGLHVLLGLEASTVRRWTLDRQGWRLVGSVSGRSWEDCERRFFDAWLGEDAVRRVATGAAASGSPAMAAVAAGPVMAEAGPAPPAPRRGWLRLAWRRR